MQSLSLSLPNFFYWVKDTKFRFVSCNETFAEAAGADSPEQMIGKTDFDVCWRDRAKLYHYTDCYVMQGNHYINQPEPLSTVRKQLDMLVSKYLLFDKSQKLIGIVGSNVDISGYCLIKKAGWFDAEKDIFRLGNNFGNEYLTRAEVNILKFLLLGHTSKKIGKELNTSFRTVEGHIHNMKLKLQCLSKSDLIATAIQNGFMYLLLEKNPVFSQLAVGAAAGG